MFIHGAKAAVGLRITGLMAGLALAAGLVGCSNDDGGEAAGPTPTPSPTSSSPVSTPSPTVATSKPPTKVTKKVGSGISGFANAAADPNAVKAGKVPATGQALLDLQTMLAEYEEYGWTVHGKVKVVSQRVISMNDQEAVVRACLDDSGITIRDKSGAKVERNAGGRSLNILTLHREGKTWVVAETKLPRNPDC